MNFKYIVFIILTALGVFTVYLQGQKNEKIKAELNDYKQYYIASEKIINSFDIKYFLENKNNMIIYNDYMINKRIIENYKD